jgi:GNAT superfamily N-acetyltransferase
MKMIVRPVRHEDIDALVRMAASMHSESIYASLPFDEKKVRGMICWHSERPETRCMLVAEACGELVGMLAGYLTDYLFCHEKLACDTALFVERRHRGSTAAPRLIRAFRDWAAARGAREVCLGISTDISVERTGKFYERMGFKHVGGVYKQRVSSDPRAARDGGARW